RQKRVRVRHLNQLTAGDQFDVTLSFEWEIARYERLAYDGINLMYFRHPVQRVQYRALLTWEPKHITVHGYGVERISVIKREQSCHEDLSAGGWRYSTSIDEPAPIAYWIRYLPA